MDLSCILAVTEDMTENISGNMESLHMSVWLITILLSMIPLLELKVGIPYGMNHALTWGQAYLCGVIGGLVVAIVLTFLLRIVFNLLKKVHFIKHIIIALENKFTLQAQNIQDKYSDGAVESKKHVHIPVKRMIAVCVFVSIPIPLTGAWTGTAVAVFVGLKHWQSITAAGVGVLISGGIVTAISSAAGDYVFIIFYIMLALAICVFIASAIKMVLSYKKQKKALEDAQTAKGGAAKTELGEDTEENKDIK